MNPCTECDTNWCRAKAEGKDCPTYYYEPPRPHGEWELFTTIDGYTKHATCTKCGYKRKVGMGCSLDINNLPKFCENCGADMRKKEGGEDKEGKAND